MKRVRGRRTPAQGQLLAAAKVLALLTALGLSTAGQASPSVTPTPGPALSWGSNSKGALGNTTWRDQSIAGPLATTGFSFTAVSGGNRHSLGLRADGTVLSWGGNDLGQLGYGTEYDDPYPNPVREFRFGTGYIPLTGVSAIAAGAEHNLALKADGTVYSWGEGGAGQLGNGQDFRTWFCSDPKARPEGCSPTDDYFTRYAEVIREPCPDIDCPVVRGIAAVAAGARHSLALKGDGTVLAWGKDADGQLGDATYGYSSVFPDWPSPVQVLGLTTTPGKVIAIAAGGWHSLALKADGTVWSWGLNDHGQLGRSALVDPVCHCDYGARQVPGLAGIVAIAAGDFHSLALDSLGRVWAWGSDSEGQLGDATFGEPACSCRTTPVLVSGLDGGLLGQATQIAAGRDHSLAILTGFALPCFPSCPAVSAPVIGWGDNSVGQLGDGTADGKHTTFVVVRGPVPATPLSASTPLSGATTIAAGWFHSLAITGAGQTPPPTPTPTGRGGTISGKALLQGRTPTFPAQIGLGIAGITLAGQTVGTAPDGSFSFSNVPDGTFTIAASAAGYLPAERTITIANGAVVGGLPPVQLRAGDVTHQGAVTINDVAAVAVAFGRSTTSRRDTQGRIVDLNGDGVIDVQDISMAAATFGRAGSQPW